jgi:glucans biosynthesis protein
VAFDRCLYLEGFVVLAVFAASLRNRMKLLLPGLAFAGCLVGVSPAAHAFSLDDVTARAKKLAEQPYAAPVSNLPPVFAQMQFADYIKIQPKLDHLAWNDQGTPFRLGFYHQGMQFSSPVRISEIVGGKVRRFATTQTASTSAI